MQVRRVLVLIAALCIAAVGLLGGIIGTLLGLIGPAGDQLAAATLSISFLVVTTSLGLALAWHAFRAIQGRRSAAFRPRRTFLLVLVFVLAVATGQTLLSLNLVPVVTFPLFHVTAAILPPLAILALAGQALGGAASWREIILQLASGALLSTPLAFAFETILILGLIIALLLGVAIQPGGQELLQTLTTYLEDPLWLQDPASLIPAATSPAVIAIAVFALAGIIPFVEEGLKTVGVALLAYRKPSLSQAFLWGLACGAGFALVEASLNTTAGLQAWVPVIVLRVGATLMHCFTGALMGLAWYNVLAKRRWGHGIGLYAGTVSMHALWNGLTAWMAFTSLAALGQDATGAGQMMAGIGALAALAMLILLTLTAGLGLLGLTLYVRRRWIPARQGSQVDPRTAPDHQLDAST